MNKLPKDEDLSGGFDPRLLIDVAREQLPELTWLPDAFANCPEGKWQSRAYVYYVSSVNANKPGAAWQFDKNAFLHHETFGELVLDLLKGNRLGGIEFIDRLWDDDADNHVG